MAALASFLQGESITIGFALPIDYDLARIDEIKVYLGTKLFEHTITDNIVKCQIKSVDTKVLLGNYNVNFWLDDSTFGVKKQSIGYVNFNVTGATATNVSVNDGFNILANLSIEEETITVENIFYNYLKGADGNGIESITLLSTVGLVKTYRITYTDATTFDYEVKDGDIADLPVGVVIDADYVHTDNNLTDELVTEIGKVAGKQDAMTYSTDIESDKASTTKVSAIKTFYDWAVGKFIAKITNSVGWLKNDGAGNLSYSTPTASEVGAPSGSGSSSGANTGDETASTIKTKLGITTLSGSNTGDQDLSGLATNASVALKITDPTLDITTTLDAEESVIKTGGVWKKITNLNYWTNYLKVKTDALYATISNLALKANLSGGNLFLGVQSLKSTFAQESAPLGAELTDANNWTLTAGWTGDYATGFIHSSGTTTLSRTMTNAIGNLYQIAFTIANRTAGSVTIGLGGEVSNVTFASNGAKTYAPKTLATNGALIITPTTDFNGTISAISVKQITGTYAPISEIQDSSGVSNVEIRSSSSALGNTFIGKGSGRYCTTGSNNSAQGVQSLFSLTTGSYNSAQGVQSLYSLTTGSNNSAQGAVSLYSLTTGSNNSAQGIQSLFSLTTGSYNSTQGVQSLYSLTTGSYNSTQGAISLYSLTTGSNNSAQGIYSLYSLTTGSYNSTQGALSLYSLTTGSNNSAQGYNAGRHISDGTTANAISNNSVFLGASTKAQANDQTNQIVIGYNAIGGGSNTATVGDSNLLATNLFGYQYIRPALAYSDAVNDVRVNNIAGLKWEEVCKVANATKGAGTWKRTTGSSPLGGTMISLTNKTGAASVKGTVVYASPTTDNAFGINPTSGDMPFGVVFENGVADGAECWVVVSGIAEVLLVDGVGCTRSHIALSSSTTAGRIDTAATVPAATQHFTEIGHTLESKTAGTNVLVKCVLHFN